MKSSNIWYETGTINEFLLFTNNMDNDIASRSFLFDEGKKFQGPYKAPNRNNLT